MDEQQCPTSNAQQLCVVRQLLWDVISLHLYPAERDEIRRALGPSLLDENEALFAEAGALAEILGDVQLNTAALLARHSLCSNPQRSMMETEIRLLVDRLHATASTTPYGSTAVRDRDPDLLLPRSGKRDKAVLEYVATVAQIAETGGRPPSTAASLPPRPPTSLSASSRPGTSSRPPTALSASASMTLPSPRSRPGTASPTLPPGSRPSTASSAASSAATRYTDAPSVVAGVADQLNLASIEAVRDTLRGALQDEKAALLEDIEYLQGLLDAEADLQVRAAAPPPSLTELKDYSSRLAAVVAGEESRVEHEVRVSAMFAAAEQQQSRAGRLRGMVDASRRPTSGGSGGGGGGGGGSSQTLVVVHGEGAEEEAGPQQQQQRERERRHSAAPVSLLEAVTSSPLSALGGRAGTLGAVRRPGSGGGGGGAVGAEASPLPPVLPPPTASRPLSAVRQSLGPDLLTAAGAHRPDSNGLTQPAVPLSSPLTSTSAPPSASAGTASALLSGRLRPGSPGRLLQPGLGPAGPGLPSLASGSPSHQHHVSASIPAYRDSPPSLKPGAPPSPARPAATTTAGSDGRSGGETSTSGAAAPAAGAPGLRGLLQRSNSSERRPSPGVGGGGAAAVAATSGSMPPAGRTGGGAVGSRPASRTSTSSAATAAACGASASPGGVIATRLGGGVPGTKASRTASSSEPQQPTPVQPRALQGNRASVIDHLDAEVDAVRGGVAAILERYNIRPSTAGSAGGSAGSPGLAGTPATGAVPVAADSGGATASRSGSRGGR